MARFYRRHLPHWRIEEADTIYFVTWRLSRGQASLTLVERDVVARALLKFDGFRYELLAFVVMDDHVHVILMPALGVQLESVIHTWKSYTGHRLQRESSRRAPVWQHESFDRVVRDESELREKVSYIAGNPWKRWPAVQDYAWVWVEGQDADVASAQRTRETPP